MINIDYHQNFKPLTSNKNIHGTIYEIVLTKSNIKNIKKIQFLKNVYPCLFKVINDIEEIKASRLSITQNRNERKKCCINLNCTNHAILKTNYYS